MMTKGTHIQRPIYANCKSDHDENNGTPTIFKQISTSLIKQCQCGKATIQIYTIPDMTWM